MPHYIYRAKNGPGETVEGEIRAESRTAAAADIDAMGLSPIWVREKTAQDGKERALRLGGVSARDVTVFSRQLASLLKSGVPILRALSTIRDQSEKRDVSRLVEDIESRIRRGDMLSDALLQHPRIFPELYVNMIRSGEWGGVLDTILVRLADTREKDEEFRRKVQAALAYPALVIAVGTITVFVLLAFFMPRVVELFEGYRNLPLPTRILIATSNFFSAAWHWILIAALLAAAVYRRLATHEGGRKLVDRFKLRLPLLKDLIQKAEIARFSRTLGLLLESGVSVERGLDLAARTLKNSVLRGEVENVREETVRQGMPMSTGLKRAPHFPPFVAHMVAVGEESGRLENALAEVADFYEKEVEQTSRLATSLLEPVLILVVGGVVGLIVIAMLLPIFEIGGGLR
jgi:type II secretory pathway component PulF